MLKNIWIQNFPLDDFFQLNRCPKSSKMIFSSWFSPLYKNGSFTCTQLAEILECYREISCCGRWLEGEKRKAFEIFSSFLCFWYIFIFQLRFNRLLYIKKKMWSWTMMFLWKAAWVDFDYIRKLKFGTLREVHLVEKFILFSGGCLVS